MHAFRKLREWRKLHELCWTPPSSLSRPYGKAQLEKLQEKLDNRGGKKKETVYDLVKRQKKKIRAKMVMNQKANSVADLAAVLKEQDVRVEDSSVREQRAQSRLSEAASQLKEMEEGPEREAALKKQEGLKQKFEQVRLRNAGLDPADGQGQLRRHALAIRMEKLEERIARYEDALKNKKEAQEFKGPLAKPTKNDIEKILDSIKDEKQRVRDLQLASVSEATAVTSEKLEQRTTALTSLEQKQIEAKDRLEKLRQRTSQKKEDLESKIAQLRAKEKERKDEKMQLETDLWKALEKRNRGESYNGSETQRVESQEPRKREDNMRRKLAENELREETNSMTFQHLEKELKLLQAREERYSRKSEKLEARSKQTIRELAFDRSTLAALKLHPELPKRGALRQNERRLSAPNFSLQGVVVEWSDLLDADYAQEWPQAVTHAKMRRVKYTAPVPQTAEQIQEAERRLEEMEDKEAEEVDSDEDGDTSSIDRDERIVAPRPQTGGRRALRRLAKKRLAVA